MYNHPVHVKRWNPYDKRYRFPAWPRSSQIFKPSIGIFPRLIGIFCPQLPSTNLLFLHCKMLTGAQYNQWRPHVPLHARAGTYLSKSVETCEALESSLHQKHGKHDGFTVACRTGHKNLKNITQVEQSEVGLYSLADAVSRVCEELGVITLDRQIDLRILSGNPP